MSAEVMDATETKIDVDGFEIRAVEMGSGSPVVVLHGSGGISTAPGLEMLAQHFRTIALELPGFGYSPANDRASSMRDIAATVTAAVESLGVEEHAIVSTSVSARIALWHAIASPQVVLRLALISPAAILPEGVRLPSVLPEQLIHSATTGAASPVGFVNAGLEQKEAKLLDRAFGDPRDAELELAMSTLDVPTLVVFGDDDYLVPPSVGRIYRELMPRCHNILVHGAGPLIAHERPEAFASVVTDFLQWGDEFVYSHKTGVLHP